MRLDKFLKVSRLIKRRTMAKEACDKKQVFVNDRPAKAGTEVNPGDILKLFLGPRRMTVRIKDVKDTVPAKEAASLYELIEDYRVNDEI